MCCYTSASIPPTICAPLSSRPPQLGKDGKPARFGGTTAEKSDWIIELEITKENNNLSLPGADGELFSPELLRGQHIFFSSLLQIFAFNRDNIWAAAVGLELLILEKHESV